MKKKRCHIVKISNEARVLKQLRINSKLSMREAGFRIGKSDSYISHLENGRMDIPAISQLCELLEVYSCSLQDFLEKVEQYKEETPKIDILSNLIRKLDESKVNTLLDLTESFLNNSKQRI